MSSAFDLIPVPPTTFNVGIGPLKEEPVIPAPATTAVKSPADVAPATKAVVANFVELFPAVCVTPVVPVGRDGVPVNA